MPRPTKYQHELRERPVRLVVESKGAVMLGWSPVTRTILGLKRRCDPTTGETRDGGGAVVIEEGIAATAFGYASQHRYVDQVTRPDQKLFDTIQMITCPAEVGVRTDTRQIRRSEEVVKVAVMASPPQRGRGEPLQTAGRFGEAVLRVTPSSEAASSQRGLPGLLRSEGTLTTEGIGWLCAARGRATGS